MIERTIDAKLTSASKMFRVMLTYFEFFISAKFSTLASSASKMFRVMLTYYESFISAKFSTLDLVQRIVIDANNCWKNRGKIWNFHLCKTDKFSEIVQETFVSNRL